MKKTILTFIISLFSFLSFSQVTPVGPKIPSQSGHAGKYLKTNGSKLSWATVSAGLSASLTAGYIPFAYSNDSLSNSIIYQSSNFLGIGTNSQSSISPFIQLNSNLNRNYFQFTGSSDSRGVFMNCQSNDWENGFLKVVSNSPSFAGSAYEPSGLGSVIRSGGDGTNVPLHLFSNFGKVYISGSATYSGATPSNVGITVDNGKVGIGTINPAKNLHVVGTVSLDGLPTSSVGLSSNEIYKDAGCTCIKYVP